MSLYGGHALASNPSPTMWGWYVVVLATAATLLTAMMSWMRLSKITWFVRIDKQTCLPNHCHCHHCRQCFGVVPWEIPNYSLREHAPYGLMYADVTESLDVILIYSALSRHNDLTYNLCTQINWLHYKMQVFKLVLPCTSLNSWGLYCSFKASHVEVCNLLCRSACQDFALPVLLACLLLTGQPSTKFYRVNHESNRSTTVSVLVWKSAQSIETCFAMCCRCFMALSVTIQSCFQVFQLPFKANHVKLCNLLFGDQ